MSVIALIVFLVGVAMSMPVSAALGFGGLFALLTQDRPLVIVSQRLFTSIDSMALMALPFFIFTGELMTKTDIMNRLLQFTNLLVGWLRGGLAYVSIIASMFFAGISGSASAEASAIGSVMIPAMRREYDSRFSVALISSCSVIGPIIPPSIPFILYTVVVPGVSVSALFLAGVVPGIMLGMALMAITYLGVPRYYKVRHRERAATDPPVTVTLRAVPALIMPLIILGGVLSGAATATEAGAIAVLYAMTYGLVARSSGLTLHKVYLAARQTVLVTGMCFLIIACASIVSWILAYEKVPYMLESALKGVSDQAWVFLLTVNVILFFAGMILDATAIIILLAPIMAPIAQHLGINPVHFGLVFVFNCMIGMVTPPVGGSLIISCGIGNTTIDEVLPVLIPFVIVMVTVLLLLTYVPQLSLWLPKLAGAFS